MSNTKQKVAITVVAVVLVLAVVTVAALAIAGVFGKKAVSDPFATAEGVAVDQQVIRNFDEGSSLYLSSNFTGNPADVVVIRDSDGNAVPVKALADHGVRPAAGWQPGMSYAVSISDNRYSFAGGEADGLSQFVCTVAKAQAQEINVKEGLIYLSDGEYQLDGNTLTVYADPGFNPVFVIDNGLDSRSLKLGNEKYVARQGDAYVMTVVDAAVEDVYAGIDFTQSYDLSNAEFAFDEQATLASVVSSDFYLAAIENLYGSEMLGKIDKLSNEWVTTSVDFVKNDGLKDFNVDITVEFRGIIKKGGVRDKNSVITVKITNNVLPKVDVNLQAEDGKKAFDLAVDLDVHTAASIVAKYDTTSNPGDKDSLQAAAQKLAEIAGQWTKNDKPGLNKGYIFGHWQFPIGTLPICIDYQMGIQVKAEFSGKVGVTATNDFSLTFGAVYVDGNLQPFHNVEDTFKMGTLSMLGTAGLKAGLDNLIGISAYGVITVDLEVVVGPYVDLAGKLDVDLDALIHGNADVVPAYYLESGAYIDLYIKGQVFKWTIAEKELLSKKFPLFTLGNKYIPTDCDVDGNALEHPFQDETLYLNGSYLYLTGYEVLAWDIQDISAAPTVVTLGYDQFNYAIADSSLLTLDGNKLKVAPNSPAEFKTTVTVTSKANKNLSKVLTIVKNPELPTVAEGQETQLFDKNPAMQADVSYPVVLNGSAFQRAYIDGVAVGNVILNDKDGLVIERSAMSGLSYGNHRVLVESNKGYLALNLRVINSAALPQALTANFDKASAQSVSLNVDLQGNAILSFADGNYTYRASSNTLTIPAEFLMGKDVGLNSLKLVLDGDKEIEVLINVSDNRQARLGTNVYEYIKNGSDLNLDVELYGNEVNGLLFDGVALPAGTSISKDVLAAKAAGTYQGKLTAGKASFDFAVTIADNNVMVVPVKYASYDKASGSDLHLAVLAPQGKSVSLSGCDQASFASDVLTIPASFLANLPVGEWKGELSGNGIANRATITILVSNSGKPALTSSASLNVEDKDCQFTFNWEGVKVEDVQVEGLNADQYVLSGKTLTVKVSTLAYGNNPITVFTPVNSITLNVTRRGNAVLTKDSVALNKTNPQEVTFEVALAHESFVEVKLFKGDKDMGLVPTDYRFANGIITLANELVYNLEEGNYQVKVILSESTLNGSLAISGALNTYKAVGSGDGSLANPILLFTAEQLADLGNTKKKSEVYNKHFRLMADIDMRGVEMQPIGDKQQPFVGSFDGNGYSIYNLKITKAVDLKIDGQKIGAAIGLFAFNNGTIKNLRLVNPVVDLADSGAISAGIIAGFNSGRIEGVNIVDGSIKAVSKSWLDIKSAYFDLGAVAGTNEGGIIRNVSVSADIQGSIKGIKLLGIQITGRKSLINAGAVVGYATKGADGNGKLVGINVTASLEVNADNNNVNTNGWYGYTDIEGVESQAKRVYVSIN